MPQQILPRNGEEKMPKEVAAIIFFFAWLTAGATIDSIFDSGGARMTFIIAMVVIVACAAVMGRKEE